jgi:hypothetical protein
MKTQETMTGGLVLATLAALAMTPAPTASAAPTDGWTQKSWTYTMHKPYNLNLSDRFKYSGGVWYTWVYESDKCFQDPCSATDGRRTELRWNNNYTSGNRMWDGDIYMVSGTNEATVIQVFGGATSSTATQVRGFTASSGTFKRYGSDTLITGINNTWVNIKIAHDANANSIKMYVNNTLKRTDPDRGDATHYFKNGVYVGDISSVRSETRYKNLKQWAR